MNIDPEEAAKAAAKEALKKLESFIVHEVKQAYCEEEESWGIRIASDKILKEIDFMVREIDKT